MMNFKDMYDLAIKIGMDADPRSKAELTDMLKKRKEAYKKLDKKKQEYFDMASLDNPYYDTRILHEGKNKKVKTILSGIDMEPTDLVLAAQLGNIDAVVGHHPEGPGLLGLGNDMPLQNSVMHECGVPINVAEKILHPRKSQIDRGVHPTNFIRPLHTAELLDMNYMCLHTVADNNAYQFVTKHIKSKGKKIKTVGDIVDALMEIPEYQMASKLGNAPMIVSGSAESTAGRVEATEFTGGTSGNEDIYEKLSQAGVGTIISMHMSEKHRKEAEKHHLNVVVAGHMASDSIGLNLILDAYEAKGVKIVPCGMFRVSRVKGKKKK